MIAWVHQKLAFWFPAVGESGHSEFDRSLVYANLRRQHVLIWVFISFHLAVICQNFVRTGSIHLPYIETGHLGMLFSCIIFLIAIGRPTSRQRSISATGSVRERYSFWFFLALVFKPALR